MKGTLEQRMRVSHESVYSSHLPIAQSKDVSYTNLVLNSMVTPRRGSLLPKGPISFPPFIHCFPHYFHVCAKEALRSHKCKQPCAKSL